VGIRGEIWRNPTCRIQAIENPMRLNDQKRERKKKKKKSKVLEDDCLPKCLPKPRSSETIKKQFRRSHTPDSSAEKFKTKATQSGHVATVDIRKTIV